MRPEHVRKSAIKGLVGLYGSTNLDFADLERYPQTADLPLSEKVVSLAREMARLKDKS